MWQSVDHGDENQYDRIEPVLLESLDSLDIGEHETPKPSRYGRALGLSVGCHLILFSIILSVGFDTHPISVINKKTAVHLRLVPPPPSPTSSPSTPPSPAVPDLPKRSEAQPQDAQPRLVDVPEVTPPFDFNEPPPVEIDTTANSLSTMQLRQLVDSYLDSSSQQPQCTPSQENSELFDCPKGTPLFNDFSQADATYDFFTRSDRIAVQRGQRAQELQRIASSLNSSDFTGDAIDTFIRSIDVQQQDQHTSTNARLNSLRDGMLQNDSTYQLKKRVLNP